jgi:hypothetical protein
LQRPCAVPLECGLLLEAHATPWRLGAWPRPPW